MKCSFCGREQLSDESQVCPSCGLSKHKVPPPPPIKLQTEERSPSESSSIIELDDLLYDASEEVFDSGEFESEELEIAELDQVEFLELEEVAGTLPGVPVELVESVAESERRSTATDIVSLVDDGTSPEIALSSVLEFLLSTEVGSVHGVNTSFVGREEELRRAVAAHERACEERKPFVVALSGRSGVGKTRLVLECLELLRSRGQDYSLMTSFSRSHEIVGRDLVSRLIASRLRLPFDEKLSQEARESQLEERIAELFTGENRKRAFEVLSALFDLPASVEGEVQSLRRDRAQLRRALSDLVSDLLAKEAKKRSVVLWFDDLDYDDADGLIELCEMFGRLRATPALVFMATEDREVLPAEQFLISGVSFEEIELSELPEGSMGEVVRGLLRNVEELPEQLVSMVVKKAQGIPLVAEQIVRLLVDHGIITVSGASWSVHLGRIMEAEALPSTIEELAKVRIDALDERQRLVLETAALLGSPFLLSDLARILRLEPLKIDEIPWFSEARERWTRESLQAAVEAEILAFVDDGYEFRFANEVELLKAQISEDRARMVHGVYAKILSQKGAEKAVIAAHLEDAALFRAAARMWLETAIEAERGYLYQASFEVYSHCLELLGPEDDELYLKALMGFGRVAMRLGEFSTAERAFEVGLQTAFAFEFLESSVEVFGLLGLAQLETGQITLAQVTQRHGQELAKRAENKALLATAKDCLAVALRREGSAGVLAEALKILESSLELRRQVGVAQETADTLDRIGQVCVGRADLNRALACFSESLNARRAVNDWFGSCSTLTWLGHVAALLGQESLAERHFMEAEDVCARAGDLVSRVEFRLLRADFALRRGKIEEAATWHDRSSELLKTMESPLWESRALSQRALILLKRDLLVGAYDVSREALALARESGCFEAEGEAKRVLAIVQGEMANQRVKERPSLTQTRDLFLESLSLLEEMGGWHQAAATLRAYGAFLAQRGKDSEAKRCYIRAQKLDPLTKGV